MAHILSQAAGFISMAFWYHFAILFEALFILTAVDAGTRAGRFMLQDLLGVAVPSLKRTDSLAANVIATALCVAAWGYFLYQGVVDPLGGINTLWPLFGIANQMLAAMALTLCFVVLFKMKRHMYAWVAGVPMLFLLVCTTSAGLTKIFSADPRVGFLALADKYQAGIAQNHIIGPAKTLAEMQRLVFNNQLNAALTALFIFVMISVLLFGLRTAYQAYQLDRRSDREVSYQALPTLK
jgi:carbon starvation protein